MNYFIAAFSDLSSTARACLWTLAGSIIFIVSALLLALVEADYVRWQKGGSKISTENVAVIPSKERSSLGVVEYLLFPIALPLALIRLGFLLIRHAAYATSSVVANPESIRRWAGYLRTNLHHGVEYTVVVIKAAWRPLRHVSATFYPYIVTAVESIRRLVRHAAQAIYPCFEILATNCEVFLVKSEEGIVRVYRFLVQVLHILWREILGDLRFIIESICTLAMFFSPWLLTLKYGMVQFGRKLWDHASHLWAVIRIPLVNLSSFTFHFTIKCIVSLFLASRYLVDKMMFPLVRIYSTLKWLLDCIHPSLVFAAKAALSDLTMQYYQFLKASITIGHFAYDVAVMAIRQSKPLLILLRHTAVVVYRLHLRLYYYLLSLLGKSKVFNVLLTCISAVSQGSVWLGSTISILASKCAIFIFRGLALSFDLIRSPLDSVARAVGQVLRQVMGFIVRGSYHLGALLAPLQSAIWLSLQTVYQLSTAVLKVASDVVGFVLRQLENEVRELSSESRSSESIKEAVERMGPSR